MNPVMVLASTAEASGASSVTMSNLTAAIGNVFTVVGNVANEVMANPVTAMFFVAGLIGLGCGILGRLKHV